MDGYLQKIGFKSGKWQKRHCVLRNCVFSYAATSESMKKTSIAVDKTVCVQTVELGAVLDNALASGMPEQRMQAEFSFKLTCAWKGGIRAFYLIADTEEIRDSWVCAFINELKMMFDGPKRKLVQREASLAFTRPLAATPLFLEIVGAARLPPAPESLGAYVRVRGEDEDGKELFPWMRGPPMKSATGSPLWRAFFSTRSLITSKCFLCIEVRERSAKGPSKDDVLVGQFNLYGLQLYGRVMRRLERPADPTCSLEASVILQRIVPLFRRKVLFLVRAAAARPAEAKGVDLPLGPEGFRAARLLNKLWAEPKSSACRKEMLDVDAIITSPMCRALQTAVVAFYNLPSARSIQLSSLCRELRTPSARDATGSVVGRSILERALTELRAFTDLPPSALTFDIFDCHSPWWSSFPDAQNEIDERLTHFRSMLHCLKFRAAVLVSHHFFLHDLISSCSSSAVLAQPVTQELLSPTGFPCAELVRVELDLDAPTGPTIVALERPWRLGTF